MAAIENDLRTYLLTQTPITALVGTRIYAGYVPQGAAFPAIVYSRISGVRAHTLAAGGGYESARVQLSVFAASYVTAKSIAEALRGELQGFSGTMGSSTVQSVLLDGEVDLPYEPANPLDAGDVGTFHVAVDVLILHTETVPTFS